MTRPFLLLLAGVLLAAAPAFAEEGAPPPGTMTMIEFIRYGATVGHVIIFVSVVCLGMSIERGFALRRDAVIPPDPLSDLEELFARGELERAMAVCEASPSFLSNVVVAGLPKVGRKPEELQAALGEALDYEATKLSQSVSYLSYLSSLAPLLGLFGTVTGMITAFDQIARSPNPPTPAQLAGGIQQALVTTCEGLMVAIPFGLVYFVYRNRVQRLILEVNAIVGDLYGRLEQRQAS